MHLAKERDWDTRFAQDALASAGIGVIRIVKTRTFPAESEGLALAQEYAIKILCVRTYSFNKFLA